MDFKQVLLGIQVELVTLGARMGTCEKTGQELTSKLEEVTAKLGEVTAGMQQMTDNFSAARRQTELLVARFNEGMEMLVQNHTEAIQKQSTMQTELDGLKARLDSLEKRLPPAAA